MVWRIIIKIIPTNQLLEPKWPALYLHAAFMQKTPSMIISLIRILQRLHGEVQQKPGGLWRSQMIFGLVDLCGQDLIIAANPHRLNGRTSVHILALWMY